MTMDKSNDINLPPIGKRIRKLREMCDFSQEFVANELNMIISGYSRIERDEVKITLDKLIIIGNILNITIDELLNFNEKDFFNSKKNDGADSYYGNVNYNHEVQKLEDVYKDQIKSLKEEIVYLRELISKMT